MASRRFRRGLAAMAVAATCSAPLATTALHSTSAHAAEDDEFDDFASVANFDIGSSLSGDIGGGIDDALFEAIGDEEEFAGDLGGFVGDAGGVADIPGGGDGDDAFEEEDSDF